MYNLLLYNPFFPKLPFYRMPIMYLKPSCRTSPFYNAPFVEDPFHNIPFIQPHLNKRFCTTPHFTTPHLYKPLFYNAPRHLLRGQFCHTALIVSVAKLSPRGCLGHSHCPLGLCSPRQCDHPWDSPWGPYYQSCSSYFEVRMPWDFGAFDWPGFCSPFYWYVNPLIRRV